MPRHFPRRTSLPIMTVDNSSGRRVRNPAQPKGTGERRCAKFLLLGVLLLLGCKGVEGPLYRRDHPERIDDPRLTIEEQQRRERDRIALPDSSSNVGPPTYRQPP